MSLEQKEAVKVVSFAPQVIADSSGKWVGNALRFATKEEAVHNVQDLYRRWTSVQSYRVVESADQVNAAWIDGKLVEVKP